MKAISRECLKYARCFRWWILAYVIWMIVVTVVIGLHVAYASDSAGWRTFAWLIEGKATWITWGLLSWLMVMLFIEDSFWDARAFWRTRPLERRDLTAARLTWLISLGFLLPFLSEIIITQTAQIPLAESLLISFRHGLVCLMVALLAALAGMLSTQSTQALGFFVLLIPVVLFHSVVMHGIRERGYPFDLIYVGLALVIMAVSMGIASRSQSPLKALLAVYFGLLLLVPALLPFLAAKGEAAPHKADAALSESPQFSLIQKDAKTLQLSLLNQNVYYWMEIRQAFWKAAASQELHLTRSGLEEWELKAVEDLSERGVLEVRLSALREEEEVIAKVPWRGGATYFGPGLKIRVDEARRECATIRFWHQNPLFAPSKGFSVWPSTIPEKQLLFPALDRDRGVIFVESTVVTSMSDVGATMGRAPESPDHVYFFEDSSILFENAIIELPFR